MFKHGKVANDTHREQMDIISWRGHEITRIEAFSDAVFALAITLLAVSLDVPKNFAELWVALKGFMPFAVCFLLFFQVWSAQNQFFRRFGLHDEMTIRLNAILLFAVLFFVYPLKFLFTLLFQSYNTIDGNQMQLLMYIYGAGFMVIYLLLGLMYRHANNRSEHLKLTAREAFETRTFMYKNYGVASVGVVSMLVAAIPNRYCLMFSGISYALIGIVVSRIMKTRTATAQSLFANTDNVKKAVHNEPVGEHIHE